MIVLNLEKVGELIIIVFVLTDLIYRIIISIELDEQDDLGLGVHSPQRLGS